MTITPTAVKVSLLATDWANSVTRRVSDSAQIDCNYTAYGHLAQGPGVESDSGFNGQHRETSGAYLLGNGYRAYLPTLGRFNAPDNLSPFGSGGLNSYTYCQGEPINRSDPSGHGDNAWSYAMIGLGLFAVAGGIGIAAFKPKLLGLGLGTAAGGALAASIAPFGLGPIDKDFSRNINIAAAVFLVGGVAGGAIVSRKFRTKPIKTNVASSDIPLELDINRFGNGHRPPRARLGGAVTPQVGAAQASATPSPIPSPARRAPTPPPPPSPVMAPVQEQSMVVQSAKGWSGRQANARNLPPANGTISIFELIRSPEGQRALALRQQALG